MSAILHLLPDEPTADELAPEESSHAALLARREKEARALQAAWTERAAIHEALTKAGVPAGDALDRVHWLIRQWRKDGSP